LATIAGPVSNTLASSYGYFKEEVLVVWVASSSLYNALGEVMSSERLDDRDDSKVLADLELLWEKADDL